jgi:peptidoglycan/LPS O-acetylase OafA/YrhL
VRYDPQAAAAALRRSWLGSLAGGLRLRGRRKRAAAVTLGEKLRQREHNQNGFDTIRLIAAALVLVSHSFPIGTGSNAREPLTILTSGQTTFGGLSVAVFFFISGLLISNSFEASRDLTSFVRKRALRIMPALIVVCCLLVFVLGPLTTNVPLGAYFQGAWRYLGQAVFLPTANSLPGVFDQHPVNATNGSLWSLRFEVACYAGSAVLVALNRGRLAAAVGVWISSFLISRWLNAGTDQPGALFYLGTMAGLYRFFGAGVVIYLLRDRVVLNKQAAWIALALSLIAIATPFFMETAATVGAYALLVFAYECPQWFRRITARGDISYGTYLYAFPIQQLMFSLVGGRPWLMTATALPLTLLAATLSWLVIERPALRMKRKTARSRETSVTKGRAGTKLPTW